MRLAVTIDPARADESDGMAQLMQLYLHDFSQFAPLDSLHGEIGRDGRFAYPNLASYWSDSRREALLIRASGRLAGFVLVNDWSATGRPVDFAIAEFFVARKYRRHGVGTEAARQLLRSRLGTWEVPVAVYNQPALAFWSAALPAIHRGAIDSIASSGSRWDGTIFRFEVTSHEDGSAMAPP